MPSGDGGLGLALVGEKIAINQRNVSVTKLLGEGGFSYVYLCKDMSDGSSHHQSRHGDSKSSKGHPDEKSQLVLKVTSIHSRAQRDIAEKEAKLLSRLSHPSIIKMYDTCYRQVNQSGGFLSKDSSGKPQHLILMEFCEGGHALDVCNQLAQQGKRFDLSTLIIAFGQICNAVSYLHAQRPPIVHRDLKPVNFLVKNGAYKLCDFGSAVFGHVDIRTPKARADAEEVIEKTTTQMFRAPEMVDLYSVKRLTQATDVWALGCCLYSLAFLQNCFEEGSNLAILSRKYKIPDDNPYGDGLVELLDRMLTTDAKARSDMTEVILCLSAVYSGRPLPPRKRVAKSKKTEETTKKEKKKEKKERTGTFRTDGQGIYNDGISVASESKKKSEPIKLNPNSAAARRRKQSQAADKAVDNSNMEFATSFHSRFGTDDNSKINEDAAFSTTDNFFADVSENKSDKVSDDAFGNDVFATLGDVENGPGDANDVFAAFDDNAFDNMKIEAKDFSNSFSAGEKVKRDHDQQPTESREKREPKRGVRRTMSEDPSGGGRRSDRGGRRRRPKPESNHNEEDQSVMSSMTERTEQTAASSRSRHRPRDGDDDRRKHRGDRDRNHRSRHRDGDKGHSDRHRDKECSLPRRSKSTRGLMQSG